MELLRFLGGALALIAPGVFLAGLLGLGRNRFERSAHGASLGLALSVYLASVISHWNLHGFYPIWACIGLGLLVAFWKMKRSASDQTDRSVSRWMVLVLLLVGVTRFAIALPQTVPMGDDPAVGLILARKLQLTARAVSDWTPFEPIPLTYPTGAHMLVALVGTISGLPLYTTFKDLIPLLGVLSTAQIFLLTRGATKNAAAGLYAALAYGFWTGCGSMDYYFWGGLPNELAMLFLVAMLSTWLDNSAAGARVGAMSLFLAALILTHHHVLVAGSGVIALTLAWTLARPAYRRAGVILGLSVAGAALLDGFYLIPYAAKLGGLASTNALHSEWPLRMGWYFRTMGWPFLIAAAAGAAFWARRREARCHPVVGCACVAIVGMFIACEYILPALLYPPSRLRATVFVPSRFLLDLDYFLAVLVGLAVASVQSRLGLPRMGIVIAMLLVGICQFDVWEGMLIGTPITPAYVEACEWIRQNTSPDTVVLDGNRWTLGLAWRRGAGIFPLPDSEPHEQLKSHDAHWVMVMAAKSPPDSPEMKFVRIVPNEQSDHLLVLWRGDGGLCVVQVWPPSPRLKPWAF